MSFYLAWLQRSQINTQMPDQLIHPCLTMQWGLFHRKRNHQQRPFYYLSPYTIWTHNWNNTQIGSVLLLTRLTFYVFRQASRRPGIIFPWSYAAGYCLSTIDDPPDSHHPGILCPVTSPAGRKIDSTLTKARLDSGEWVVAEERSMLLLVTTDSAFLCLRAFYWRVLYEMSAGNSSRA